MESHIGDFEMGEGGEAKEIHRALHMCCSNMQDQKQGSWNSLAGGRHNEKCGRG